MSLDAIFFGSYVAATLGQFSDVRTTQVALAKGFVEANSLAAKIIAKVGISPLYAVKMAVLPLLGVVLVGLGHEKIAIDFEFGVGAVGFVFGLLNYLKLRKVGVTLGQLFSV